MHVVRGACCRLYNHIAQEYSVPVEGVRRIYNMTGGFDFWLGALSPARDDWQEVFDVGSDWSAAQYCMITLAKASAHCASNPRAMRLAHECDGGCACACQSWRRSSSRRDGARRWQSLDDDQPIDPAYCPYWKLSLQMATTADWLTLMVVFSLVCLFIASERRQQRCIREVRARRHEATVPAPPAMRRPSRRLGADEWYARWRCATFQVRRFHFPMINPLTRDMMADLGFVVDGKRYASPLCVNRTSARNAA